MSSRHADPTEDDSSVRTTDETTPLLNAPGSGQRSQQQNGGPASSHGNLESPGKPGVEHEAPNDKDGKPMPYVQIFFLCYSSLGEPIAYFAIFPFINEMIQRTGNMDEKNVGFWSGMIESLFSLVQMVLMILYGRAADRLGRKPVLVFSLTGIAFATALFGMSQKLWQMVVARCLAGVFAGSVVTVRTMISELTTKETQGRAFSWYMFVRNLGIFLGPLIGGALANPAEQFPRVFGGVPFWEKYPYALATYVAGGVVLSGAISNLIFVKETLKRKSDNQSNPEPPMSTWEVMQSPGVPFVLYLFGHMMLTALSYTAVLPVVMFTSVKSGGFGFSDQWISIFLALGGGAQALWMLIAFPPLQKKFSTGSVMRWCAFGYPIFMMAYPIFNEFLRQGWTLAFWIAAPTTVVVGSYVSMAFACIQLCINDIAPSSTVLGTLNALALTVNSGVRGFAPVLSTSIFAVGVKWGFADGHLVWFYLVVLSAGLYIATLYLPEAAQGKIKSDLPSQQGDEEDEGAV